MDDTPFDPTSPLPGPPDPWEDGGLRLFSSLLETLRQIARAIIQAPVRAWRYVAANPARIVAIVWCAGLAAFVVGAGREVLRERTRAADAERLRLASAPPRPTERTTVVTAHAAASRTGSTPSPTATATRWATADVQTPAGSRLPSVAVTA